MDSDLGACEHVRLRVWVFTKKKFTCAILAPQKGVCVTGK